MELIERKVGAVVNRVGLLGPHLGCLVVSLATLTSKKEFSGVSPALVVNRWLWGEGVDVMVY